MERMTELQQSKYQDLQAGLPSELSMQLAEVALALGSAEDQVTNGFHCKTKKCCDVFAFLFFLSFGNIQIPISHVAHQF